MNTRKLIVSLLLTIVSFCATTFAQTQTTEVTVGKVVGTVTATLADGSTVAVKDGTKLPQGATITTGAKSEAYLVTHGDSLTAVTENSVVMLSEVSVTATGGRVTEEKTTIDLKSGNLVAKLNPAKKSVNNYSVRTPKGVAAARGTVFTVNYNGQTFRIAVVNGNVSFVSPNDGTRVQVGPNRLSMNGVVGDWANPDEESTAAMTQNELAVVVATLAVAAANNIGGTTTAEFASVLSTILSAAPQAAPAIAALVAVSAPSLSDAVTTAVQTLAPDHAAAAQQAAQDATNPPLGSTPLTPVTDVTVRSGSGGPGQ